MWLLALHWHKSFLSLPYQVTILWLFRKSVIRLGPACLVNKYIDSYWHWFIAFSKNQKGRAVLQLGDCSIYSIQPLYLSWIKPYLTVNLILWSFQPVLCIFSLKKNATLMFRISCRFLFLERTINKIIILYPSNLEHIFHYTSVKFIKCYNNMEIQTQTGMWEKKLNIELVKMSRLLLQFGQCNEDHNQ